MENADMNRLPEAVTTKFSELFAILHNATDDLKMAGAEACLIGDFSKVEAINGSCRKLQAFEAEIKFTVNNFASNYNARTVEKATFHKKDRNRTRKPGGRLRVIVADKVIEEATIAEKEYRKRNGSGAVYDDPRVAVGAGRFDEVGARAEA